MKIFLWLLREAGVRDTPSLPSLRKIQAGLRTECGISTHQYESVQGNVYFMNDVQKMLERVCDSVAILYGLMPSLLYRIMQTPSSVHTSTSTPRFQKGQLRKFGRPKSGGRALIRGC